MKWPNRLKSIRAQISAYFIVITVIIITVMGFSLFYTLSGIISTEAAKSTSTAINKSASYLELYIDQIKGISRILAESTETRRLFSTSSTASDAYRADKANVERLINTVLSTNKELSSIIMVGRDGRLVTNEKQLEMGLSHNMMEEPWYKAALGNDSMPVLTSAKMHDFSMDKDNWVISLSREIKGDTGEHLGVLLIDFKYDVIEKNLSSLDLGSNGFGFIINDLGEVVYHKDKTYFENDAKRRELISILDMPHDELAGQLKLIHSYHLANADWTLVGVASLDGIVRMQQDMMRLMVVLGAVMAACFLASTFYFSRRVTDPLLRLQQAMDSVEKDMLDIEITAVGGIEAENLARHFNKMMQRIRLLLAEIMEKEKYLRASELRALHSQINPHFLYNTLDTIVWMAEFKDSEKVVAITKALARFFRLSLGDGKETTTVRNEIDHVRQYLFIQKERYETKLDYKIQVDDSVLDIEMPKIILQPIVENAIYHGIRPLSQGGLVTIDAYPRGDDVVFEIKDNGVGFDTSELSAEPKSIGLRLGGVGIDNVDKRLKLYYGEDHGLTVISSPGKGTQVTIVMRRALPTV